MDLSDIEKGNFELPVNNTRALLEILRITISNQAMLNSLITVLMHESSVFPNIDENKLADMIQQGGESRFNELWAEAIAYISKEKH